MNELIPIITERIGDTPVQAVSARALHAFLEVGKVFAAWIAERIEQYGFIEKKDFEVFSEIGNNPLGGRPSKEYAITLDMAKELAMVERTARGKQARQYFIECERRAKTTQADMMRALDDPCTLRSLLLSYSERAAKLEAAVQAMEPKARFHDAVSMAVNCQTIQEVAKVLGTGQNRLFAFLREEGLLMRSNLPYQQHVNAGHFRVIERQYTDARGESHTYTRTLVTGKGLALIQKRIGASSENKSQVGARYHLTEGQNGDILSMQ